MNCCHTEQMNTHDGGHEHGHGMSHGDASSYLKRFWIVTALLIPLVATRPTVAGWLGVSFELSTWIEFGIATIVFGFALVFFEHAWHEIKMRQYGMMTLVSLAVGTGYLFSVVSTFVTALEVEFYIEIATLIWVLLFGHYLEAKSSIASGNALQEVAKLLPKRAHTIVNGEEVDVDVSSLKAGDVVLVKPGEKVPADGLVMKGEANVDESLISGESTPVKKEVGVDVVAGSICLDGALTITLSKVGKHSTVGQIQALIERASNTKPRSQRIADKAAAVLTFVAGITALVTLVVWTLVIGKTFVFGMTLAITVLVIACPHALGLAIPTVTTITTSLAVKYGFFIKDLAKLEVIRKTNYVVFDKTGTITEGAFGVTEVVALGSFTDMDVVRIAGSIEKESSHVIGHAILDYAREQQVAFSEISEFKNIAGKGVQANIQGVTYVVGNGALAKEFGVEVPQVTLGTVVYVATKDALLGYIVLADSIKPSAHSAVQELHTMGIKVSMLTGDSTHVAQAVASELGIDTYVAEVLPEQKYAHIQELQKKGNTVLMVGDGVNDAPALTQADAGIAIGRGTDVAVESGDVVLLDSDPQDIVRLVLLSQHVYRKMIQNLVWALGYNIVAIPMAAGVFAHPVFFGGIFLRPEVGALVMSLSTVIVVINALTLRRLKL